MSVEYFPIYSRLIPFLLSSHFLFQFFWHLIQLTLGISLLIFKTRATMDSEAMPQMGSDVQSNEICSLIHASLSPVHELKNLEHQILHVPKTPLSYC